MLRGNVFDALPRCVEGRCTDDFCRRERTGGIALARKHAVEIVGIFSVAGDQHQPAASHDEGVEEPPAVFVERRALDHEDRGERVEILVRKIGGREGEECPPVFIAKRQAGVGQDRNQARPVA